MKYHELKVQTPKSAKRAGRGISAGRGKTAGRGTKGQGARTGASTRPGFAGGQNPLMQQLPKLPGFRSYKTKFETVYTRQVEALKAKKVTAQTLADAGLVSNAYVNIKLISRGEITSAFTVELPAASKVAQIAIEQAGGTFTKTARLQRPKTTAKKSDK